MPGEDEPPEAVETSTEPPLSDEVPAAAARSAAAATAAGEGEDAVADGHADGGAGETSPSHVRPLARRPSNLSLLPEARRSSLGRISLDGGGVSVSAVSPRRGSPSPRLERFLSERTLHSTHHVNRAHETATILPSVFAPIEDKELELAVLAKGREVELARLMREQRKVYDECVKGAVRCQSLVERKEELQRALGEEAETNAAAVRAIKENHEIIKQRTRELHLKHVAVKHQRADATDSDLFNSQEHQRRLLERQCLDLERRLVSADKALKADRSKATLHLMQSSTERRRLDA
eukprot:CAMPEP_0197603856 /NCGR_PEP_ID=MMETSP1326-20131121/40019_1 /TAXON_ID=1155430 /ORGANISM="Genus nov. species nov., Strain RCC2288" /LENGTH=292 /DNA_ID=CAMNT_0043171425 /DNA_START=35 /DNA_END=910 /DNA_ORIENTATION=+